MNCPEGTTWVGFLGCDPSLNPALRVSQVSDKALHLHRDYLYGLPPAFGGRTLTGFDPHLEKTNRGSAAVHGHKTRPVDYGSCCLPLPNHLIVPCYSR